MKPQQPSDAAPDATEQAHEQQALVMRLYVAGATHRSSRTITRLLQICEQHFAGRYQLEIFDIYQHAEQAHADTILATPTLLLVAPVSGRYFVGDLQHHDRLFAALGIHDEQPSSAQGRRDASDER